MIRMVVTDLDGTLLKSGAKLSQRTIQAFSELKKRGLPIAIASGRTVDEIRRLIKPMELDRDPNVYYIAFNGALTVHAQDLTIMDRFILPPEDVADILALLDESGFQAHIFTEDTIYLPTGLKQVLGDEYDPDIRYQRIRPAEIPNLQNVLKILVFAEETALDRFKSTIPETYKERFRIFKSAKPLLEFIRKDGSKGDAMVHLARRLGIDLSDVLAFGDEENDITMLLKAGQSVAMQNAPAEVKKVARHVSLSNDDDGVAAFLENHIFRKGDGNT